MLDLQGAIEFQLGVKAIEAVMVGGKGNIVPGREAFKLNPGLPAAGHTIFACTGFLDLSGQISNFRPGLGEGFGITTSLFHGILVIVENRGRGVERHGDELAIARGVVARYGRQEFGHVERSSGIVHDFVDGTDGAFGCHHAGCSHFKDLDDVGMLFCAESCNSGGHGFIIVALVHALDFILVLGCVEVFDDIVSNFTKFPTHAMPEGNCGLGLNGCCHQHQTRGQQGHHSERTHMFSCHCGLLGPVGFSGTSPPERKDSSG